MRKLICSMRVSLDGFIAGPDGEIDWSAPDEELHRFHNQQARETGAHLYGRRLYEAMRYWETPTSNPRPQSMSSSSLSIGVFFTLMIVGLSAGLPHTLQNGLLAHGVPASDPGRVSHLPPVATLFSSFLGYNPMATLLGPHVLAGLPAAQAHALTGRSFFPHLISNPFHTALVSAFVFAIVACLVAAVASLLRGGKYHYVEATSPAGAPTGFEPVEPGAPGSSRQRVRSSNGSSTSSVHASTNSPSSPTSSPRSCARSASARPSSNGNDPVGDDDDIASHTKGGTDAHPLVRPIRVSDQR